MRSGWCRLTKQKGSFRVFGEDSKKWSKLQGLFLNGKDQGGFGRASSLIINQCHQSDTLQGT